jgi:hypothetical protein
MVRFKHSPEFFFFTTAELWTSGALDSLLGGVGFLCLL